MIRFNHIIFLVIFLGLLASPAVAEDGPIGFAANVVGQRLVDVDHIEGALYAKNSFKVRLRSDNYISASDGRRIEFDTVLQTNFDELPKRIYVVIDSERSRKVIYWTEVQEIFCAPPDIAAALERDAHDRGAVTFGGGSQGDLCFLVL